MAIEYFIFKTCRFLTLIGAIIFLFLKYFALPDMVAVFFGKKGEAAGYLPKDQFFYLLSFLLIIVNILTPLLVTVFKNNPEILISKFNSFFNKNISKNTYSIFFIDWTNLIVAAFNLLILLAILIISRLNATDYVSFLGDYSWFSVFIFSLFLIIFCYPFAKVFFFKSAESDAHNTEN